MWVEHRYFRKSSLKISNTKTHQPDFCVLYTNSIFICWIYTAWHRRTHCVLFTSVYCPVFQPQVCVWTVCSAGFGPGWPAVSDLSVVPQWTQRFPGALLVSLVVSQQSRPFLNTLLYFTDVFFESWIVFCPSSDRRASSLPGSYSCRWSWGSPTLRIHQGSGSHGSKNACFVAWEAANVRAPLYSGLRPPVSPVCQ